MVHKVRHESFRCEGVSEDGLGRMVRMSASRTHRHLSIREGSAHEDVQEGDSLRIVPHD